MKEKVLFEIPIYSTSKENFDKKWKITKRQMEFLELATQTPMTYKEIADTMYLSIKTIENYQREMFKLFEVKNRPALMLFVRENNIVGFKKF